MTPKRPQNHSIVGELSRLVLGGGIILSLIAAILWLAFEFNLQNHNLQESLRTHARLIGSASAYALAFQQPEDAENILAQSELIPSFKGVFLYTPDGQLFASHTAADGGMEQEAYTTTTVLSGENGKASMQWKKGLVRMQMPVMLAGDQLGQIEIYCGLHPLYELLTKSLLVTMAILGALVIGILFLYKRLNRMVSLPLIDLLLKMRFVADSGDYSVQIDSGGHKNEIGELIQGFNLMIAQIRNQSSVVKESEARYRALMDQAVDGVLVVDEKGIIRECNHQARLAFGGESSYLLGTRWMDCVVGGNIRRFEQDWERLLNEESSWLTSDKILSASGIEKDVELKIGRVRLRDVDWMLIMIRDIGERIRAQEEIRRQGESLRIMLDSIGEAVIATDIEGNIQQMNPAAKTLFSDALSENTLGSIYDISLLNTYNEKKHKPLAVKWIQGGGTSNTSKRNVRWIAADGGERHLIEDCAPLMKKDGSLLGTVTVFNDVTHIQQLEENLNHGRKMQAIGQLAGGVAHDFNNILSCVIGAAELLHTDDRLDADLLELVDMILKSSERAGNLTHQLLAFSRKGKIRVAEVSLHRLIEETVVLLRRSLDPRIEVKLDLKAEEYVVLADDSAFASALLNLGVNARDAMPEGGILEISTCQKELTEKACDESPFDLIPGSYIELKFRDTGTGIPKEIRSRIFDPFFTTKKIGKGTGMGLAAVYGTVENHQGSIQVVSTEGKGTTFIICLPALPETQEHLEEDPVVQNKQPAEMKILLVEDEPSVRFMANKILRHLGYKVELAANGKEALDLYRAQKEAIHLVLLDLRMPIMSGEDCFKKLIELDPAVQVVICSGYTDNINVDNLLKAGVKDFLAKPYNMEDLKVVLSGVLNEQNLD